MIHKTEIIASLSKWSDEFKEIIATGKTHPILNAAYQANQWFHPSHVLFALQSIVDEFLQTEKLEFWLKDVEPNNTPKRIGIISAGNIPLAAFHDILSILATGNIAVIKMSSKDEKLLPYFKLALKQINSELAERIVLTEQLSGIDAIIATGSNNTNRYFEYYFGKLPHVFRKNRTSIAVLEADATLEEIQALGKDVFLYYGLGCRNISKLFLPKGFDIPKLFDTWLEDFKHYGNHSKYRNNLDYHTSIYLLNNLNHFASEFLVMYETEELHAQVGVLNFEFYAHKEEISEKINADQEAIQCIVSRNDIPYGSAQTPSLLDYPDNVNILEFIQSL